MPRLRAAGAETVVMGSLAFGAEDLRGADALAARAPRGRGMSGTAALAVDLGGTELRVAVVDATGAVLAFAAEPTPQDDPAPGVAAIAAARRRGPRRGARRRDRRHRRRRPRAGRHPGAASCSARRRCPAGTTCRWPRSCGSGSACRRGSRTTPTPPPSANGASAPPAVRARSSSSPSRPASAAGSSSTAACCTAAAAWRPRSAT